MEFYFWDYDQSSGFKPPKWAGNEKAQVIMAILKLLAYWTTQNMTIPMLFTKHFQFAVSGMSLTSSFSHIRILLSTDLFIFHSTAVLWVIRCTDSRRIRSPYWCVIQIYHTPSSGWRDTVWHDTAGYRSCRPLPGFYNTYMFVFYFAKFRQIISF